MITTGIITAINVSDNGDNNVNYLYNVEIALFQTPGDKNKDNYTYTAAACVPSSINSPFSVGDKVFIGFLCNEISVPIILGKIYNGISDKGNSYGFFNALKVDGTVELPTSTKIGDIDYSTLALKLNNVNMLNDLSTVARTGNYNDLKDTPTINSLLTSINGYDSSKTQILKNINGTFTWIDE